MTSPRIGLSTASTYPESTAHGFAWAARLGYDAVEVMVGIDALSQQISRGQGALRPPRDPRRARSTRRACCSPSGSGGPTPGASSRGRPRWPHAVGADVVVVHPPFRWQREYAAGFVDGIAALENSTGIAFAVENMYPWRASSRRGVEMYVPGWDPSDGGVRQHHDRPLPRRHRPLRRDRDGRADGHAAAAHPPHRRHRLGQGRAPRARPRRDGRRRVPAATSPSGTSPARSSSRSTPGARPAPPTASATCSSRWSSPASTSAVTAS